MAAQDTGNTAIKELRSFLTFLGSVWGLLAAVSVLFPLSNVLSAVIPLETAANGGAFWEISPGAVTTVSMISAAFCILLIYSRRRELASTQQVAGTRRTALWSFAGGLALLGVYLVLYELKADAYDLVGWQSDDSRHVFVEVPLMATYAGCFTLLTRGFTLLALIEYEGEVNTSADSEATVS